MFSYSHLILKILVCLGCLACIRPQAQDQKTSQLQEELGATETNLEQALEIDHKNTYELVFVGDIMSHQNQITSAYNSQTKTYDYTSWFEAIEPILKRADWSFGNLELTLAAKPPYTGYPCFRSPDTLSYFLKDAGFDVIVTANNHSNDNGAYGLQHTLESLSKVGLFYTGTFRDSTERADNYPLILEKGAGTRRFRLAVLNFTYGTNGIPTKKPQVVNLMDSLQIRQDLIKAKAAQPDLILALVHWGDEYQLLEQAKQRHWAKWLRAEGVDLVIGGHPHVVQPMYYDTLASGNRGFVAYSLGNYISNQERPHTDIGILLSVKVQKDFDKQKTDIVEVSYLPVWRRIERLGSKIEDWVYRALPCAWIQAEDNELLLDWQDETRREAIRTCLALQKRLAPYGFEVLNLD